MYGGSLKGMRARPTYKVCLLAVKWIGQSQSIHQTPSTNFVIFKCDNFQEQKENRKTQTYLSFFLYKNVARKTRKLKATTKKLNHSTKNWSIQKGGRIKYTYVENKRENKQAHFGWCCWFCVFEFQQASFSHFSIWCISIRRCCCFCCFFVSLWFVSNSHILVPNEIGREWVYDDHHHVCCIIT